MHTKNIVIASLLALVSSNGLSIHKKLRISDQTLKIYKSYTQSSDYARILIDDLIRLNNPPERLRSLRKYNLATALARGSKHSQAETIRQHLKDNNSWTNERYCSCRVGFLMPLYNNAILKRYQDLVVRDNGGKQLTIDDATERAALAEYPTKEKAYNARFGGKWCLSRAFGTGNLHASIALLAHGKADHARRVLLLQRLMRDNGK